MAPDTTTLGSQTIPSNGLTVLVHPARPKLDVIFIHGFTGHPEKTWTHSGDANHPTLFDDGKPAAESRRTSHFWKPLIDHGPPRSPVFWPRDMLPNLLPDARVMTYGYDTRVRHAFGSLPSTNTVYQIAGDLLVALEGERRDAATRPIVFIVHSLGGIVLKEMIRRSYSCQLSQQQFYTICKSTTAILFFGTPHGGADPRGPFLLALAKAIKLVGFSTNPHIVNTLLPSSERLMELRDEFTPMAQKFGWLIHSFQEGVGLRFLNGNKVVEDNSSCLSCPGIEVIEHIAYNHMDMCRFAGATDAEYQKVARALLRVSEHCSNPKRDAGVPQMCTIGHNAERCTQLLASLRFKQMGLREMTIKKPHSNTCKWFFTQPTYLRWLDPNEYDHHHGFLRIKGKPRAGKSTLMKYLLRNFYRKRKGDALLSFFFNAGGNPLEMNTQGMYRSLLVQLIEDDIELQRACCSLLKLNYSTEDDWNLEVLKDLLEAVIAMKQGQVTIFVDALDECDEDEVREMLSFYKELGEAAAARRQRLLVCLSSRHYPNISIPQGLEVVLEREEGHARDIAHYLRSELNIGHSVLAETIRLEVLEKASGIFMWVVRVVQVLNQEYDHGRITYLPRDYRGLPRGLNELFDSFLERESRNHDQLLFCIQLLLFAAYPLSPMQFYHAVLAGTDIDNLTPFDFKDIADDAIDKFILKASRGFVEVKWSEVQFIHESVRQFFLVPQNIAKFFPAYGSHFPEKSHEAIAKSCQAYIRFISKNIITFKLKVFYYLLYFYLFIYYFN